MGVDAAELTELGLRIVDDDEMAELHLRYMGEPGPTDVLSFSAGELAQPEPYDEDVLDDDVLGVEGEGWADELAAPPIRHGLSFGDLVLDWQAVQRQASSQTRQGLLDEATVLAVHGLAHLLGHDHRTRAESRRMHALERRGLRAVAVADPPRPYAPRLLRRAASEHEHEEAEA